MKVFEIVKEIAYGQPFDIYVYSIKEKNKRIHFLSKLDYKDNNKYWNYKVRDIICFPTNTITIEINEVEQ